MLSRENLTKPIQASGCDVVTLNSVLTMIVYSLEILILKNLEKKVEGPKMTFNCKKQNRAKRGKKRLWYGERERQEREKDREREREGGSKSDFAVQWCCWIIMKMKATESGSIGEQENGAKADNTVKAKKKRTNKRTTVERRKRSVRQY